MAKILNNNSLSQATKVAIENHIKSIEFPGDVVTTHVNSNSDDEPVYDVYSLTQEYIFSIDASNNTIFSR